ncbi:MAG: glycosyltransferase family 39 protein [Candidatus Krumholzibacteria bacterium]
MTSNRRNLTLAAVLLLALGLRLAALSVSAPTDDACITFRYAENLAEGQGFVYNTGERVLGTTTPLFTLLLLPFALAGLPLQAAAYALALAADLLVCLLVYRLIARPFGEPAALLAALFYALSYVAIAACGYGMETQVFEALVVMAILFAVQSRYAATAVAVGLAVLTRPEGALLAGILGVFILAKLHRQSLPFPWKALVVFLAVTIPWFVFATLYFGFALPEFGARKADPAEQHAPAAVGLFCAPKSHGSAFVGGSSCGSVGRDPQGVRCRGGPGRVGRRILGLLLRVEAPFSRRLVLSAAGAGARVLVGGGGIMGAGLDHAQRGKRRRRGGVTVCGGGRLHSAAKLRNSAVASPGGRQRLPAARPLGPR